MEELKENLEVQRYTVNDILSALMCVEDEDVKEVMTYHFKPGDIATAFSCQESFDEVIRVMEKYIEFYELAIRGHRQLADILQVPSEQEG